MTRWVSLLSIAVGTSWLVVGITCRQPAEAPAATPTAAPVAPPRATFTRTGVVVGVTAFDGGAILTWRGSRWSDQAAWVTRVDRAGHTHWLADLPGRTLDAGYRGAMSVFEDAGVVIVRTEEPDASATAFELDTGRMRWSRKLVAYGAKRPEHVMTTVALRAPHRLVAFTGENSGTGSAISLDPATGAEQWRVSAYYSAHDPIAGEDLAVWPGATGAIDLRSGATRYFPIEQIGCMDGDEYLVVTRSTAPALVAFDHGLELRTLGGTDALQSPHVDACATRGIDLVLLEVFAASSFSPVFKLVVVGRDGLVRRAIDLPVQVDTENLTGTLPRHAVLESSTGSRTLLGVDLDAGAVVWQTPLAEAGEIAVRLAGTHWIVEAVDAEKVSVYDGATGELAGTFAGHSGLDAANGRTLWIYGSDPGTPDTVALTAIDLATMQPLFTRVPPVRGRP